MNEFENFTLQQIPKIFSGLACRAVQLAIIIFVAWMLYTGIMFLLSRGNPESYGQAKKTFFYSLIGGVVIYGVYTIILSTSLFVTGNTTLPWVPLSCNGSVPITNPTPTLTPTLTPTPTSTQNPGTLAISNESASDFTPNSVTITWTTNVPSTSQVEYISATYGLAVTPIDNNLVTNHTVTLTGLQSGHTYSWTAISAASGYTARGSEFSFKTSLSPLCVQLDGNGPKVLVLIARNSPDSNSGGLPKFTCTEQWTSSEMSSLWITETNKYAEVLSRFSPLNTSDFTLYRSDQIDASACPVSHVSIRVTHCLGGNNVYVAHANFSLRDAWLARDNPVTVLAHELAHAFANLADEYWYNPPYPPPIIRSGLNNCSLNSCPGTLNTCFGGCNQQGPETGWKRDADNDIMRDNWIPYNQFGPIDTQVIQNCINMPC